MPNGDESSRSLTECIQANAINSGQMHQPVADGLPAAIADCSLMATSSIVGQKAAFSDDQLYEFMVNPPSKEQTNHKIGFDTDCVFQQPNEVFVFSTEVANMATEAVLQGRYRSIIQFHKDNVANCASSAQQVCPVWISSLTC